MGNVEDDEEEGEDKDNTGDTDILNARREVNEDGRSFSTSCDNDGPKPHLCLGLGHSIRSRICYRYRLRYITRPGNVRLAVANVSAALSLLSLLLLVPQTKNLSPSTIPTYMHSYLSYMSLETGNLLRGRKDDETLKLWSSRRLNSRTPPLSSVPPSRQEQLMRRHSQCHLLSS